MNVVEFDEKELNKDLDILEKDDEISKALDLIDEQTKEITEEHDDKNIIVKKEQDDDDEGYTIDDIINVTLNSIQDVNKKSDEIYDAFYGTVATRQDRSDMSKQMLVESQRLKNESIQNLVALANAKAKIIAAKAKASNVGAANGIIINTSSADQVGINLDNLKD